MDKKETIEKTKKAVGVFFLIRRIFTVYTAFITGILSGIAIYHDLYERSEDWLYSFVLAVLAGIFITGVMLLVLKIIWFVIGKAKDFFIKIYEKHRKVRETVDEKKDG